MIPAASPVVGRLSAQWRRVRQVYAAYRALRAVLNRQAAKLEWLLYPAWIFAGSRLLIFAAGILGDIFLPTEAGHWVADANSPFLSLWAKWDSQWYVQIAREGYWFQPEGQSNVAFFPLYPLLMRLLAPLVGANYTLAGFLISNGAFCLALIALYCLTELEFGEQAAARRTITYVAFFPTAFFLSSVYTDSLFLLLSVACMYAARRRQWLAAAVIGVLAAAARNLGVLLLALALWEWLRQQGWRITTLHQAQSWRQLGRGLRGNWPELVWLAAIPLGLGLYMAFLQLNFARPWAFVEAQAGWGRQNIGPHAVLLREVYHLAELSWTPNDMMRLLNVGTFVAILGLIPFIWRRLGEGYALYVLVLVLTPFSSAAQSLIRYALHLFPVFMLLGAWGRNPVVDRLLLGGFALLLGVLTTIFVNWIFVA